METIPGCAVLAARMLQFVMHVSLDDLPVIRVSTKGVPKGPYGGAERALFDRHNSQCGDLTDPSRRPLVARHHDA
jgi:hypothetical protein